PSCGYRHWRHLPRTASFSRVRSATGARLDSRRLFTLSRKVWTPHSWSLWDNYVLHQAVHLRFAPYTGNWKQVPGKTARTHSGSSVLTNPELRSRPTFTTSATMRPPETTCSRRTIPFLYLEVTSTDQRHTMLSNSTARCKTFATVRISSTPLRKGKRPSS